MKKFIAASLLSIIILAGCSGETQDGKYAQLAQCLTEKGVKMYGAFWCSHCANQKKLFGDDWQYVTYVECDPRGENGDPDACRDAGVDRYPTWIFPGQDPVIGEIQPEELATKANCEIPSEDGESSSGDATATEGESTES